MNLDTEPVEKPETVLCMDLAHPHGGIRRARPGPVRPLRGRLQATAVRSLKLQARWFANTASGYGARPRLPL